MSIASRIDAIEQHLTDDYSVLELAGADLTNVDKNIFNLKQTWKERLLYFLENGTDVVWNNWEKVTGSGTQISLSNTIEAKMKVDLKGNTYQYSTSGKNLFNVSNKSQTTDSRGITYKVENNVFTLSGTNTSTSAYSLVPLANDVQTKEYFESIFEKGKTFTLSANNSLSGLYFQINYYKEGSTSQSDLSVLYNLANKNTFTIPQDFDRIGTIFLGVLGTATTINGSFSMQLEEGSYKTEFEPYTNGASPNPDYPQDIQVVSGDNIIKIKNNDNNQTQTYPINLSSSNMFDKLQSTFGNRLDTTGKNYPETGYFISPFIKVEPSTQYTKNSPTADAFHRVAFYTSNNQNSFISVDSSNNTFTTPSTCKYLRFCGIVSEIFTTQLNEGDVVLPYQSYFTPIELCKIGTYQDKIAKSTGKNLFDISTSNSDYDNLNNTAPSYLTVSGNTLSMVIQGGGATRFYRKQNLEGNNTFTINSTTSTNEARYFVRIRKLDDSGWMTNSDYTFTSGWSYNQYYSGWYINVRSGNNDETFTIPECLYWQIGFGWDTNIFQGTIQTMSNIMLNEGNIALSYEPYGTSWYLNKQIGKVVLDGSENWSLQSINSYGIANFQHLISDYIGSVINNSYNNYFSPQTTGIADTQNEGYYLGGNKYLSIRIKSDTASTVNDFKTWLSIHNTILYFPLATPTTTEITDTTLISQLEAIKSLNEQTNISQENNDLPFELDVVALKKLD